MNAYLIGTSNSVLKDGYLKDLLKSDKINVAGSTILGDVPITNFISVRYDLEKLVRYTDLDLVIIDTCINDTLMVASEKLTRDNLVEGITGVCSIINSLTSSRCQIILLNFLPDAVKKVAVFDEVKELRLKTFKKYNLNTSEIDISNDEVNVFFGPEDALHISRNKSDLVCSVIEDSISNLSFDAPLLKVSSSSEYVYRNFYSKGFVLKNTQASTFSSLIHNEAGVIVSSSDSYSIEFNKAIKPLGLRFASNNVSSSYLRFRVNGQSYFVAIASKSKQDLVRFIPFPQFEENVYFLDFTLVAKNELTQDAKILQIPNSAEPSIKEECNVLGVTLLGLTYKSSEGNTLSKSSRKKKLKLNFQYFWPGFDPYKDKIFGDFLRSKFDVSYVSNPEYADIVVASWCTGESTGRKERYRKLKEKVNGKLVYYTAEHDGLGLAGFGQVDFEIFEHVFSHYISSNKSHTWLPNYVRRYGIGVFSEVNERYQSNIKMLKSKNVQFCYGNPNCNFRNYFYKELDQHIEVDANGKLFNRDGVYLPREKEAFIKELSKYKFVIAFENSSFRGYNTEKIVHALMAGSVPLYWGDPFIDLVWNEDAYIKVNESNIEHVIQRIANDPDRLFNDFAKRNIVPFPNAPEFEAQMSIEFFNIFNSLISTE